MYESEASESEGTEGLVAALLSEEEESGESESSELGASAYTGGNSIFAPQTQHLPHEAWHVVQQARGRAFGGMY